MSNTIQKSIASLLGGTALAIASTCATAITVTNLGTVPNNAVGLSNTSSVPQYAWDGWNGITANLGWSHTSKWYTFKLTAQTTVQIKMTTTSPAAQMKPAFSVWKTTASFVGGNHLAHEYNQVSLNGASSFLKPQPPATDGTTAFEGYVNAGNTFTNGNGNAVGKGTAGISSTAPKKAVITKTLKAGTYLIAAGGSCNNNTCGAPAPKPFTLKVVKAAAAAAAEAP
jgi:hypothetical protein